MVYKVNKKVLSDIIWNVEGRVRDYLFNKFSTKGFYHEGIGPYTLEDVLVRPYKWRFERGEGTNLLRVNGEYVLQGYLQFEDDFDYASKKGSFELVLPFTKNGKPLYNSMYIKVNGKGYEKI